MPFIKVSAAALLAFCTCVTSTSAAEPYSGKWAANVDECKLDFDEGNSVFEIEDRGWGEYEASCKITRVSRVGRIYRLEASCTGDMESRKAVKSIELRSDTSALIDGVPMVRCTPPVLPAQAQSNGPNSSALLAECLEKMDPSYFKNSRYEGCFSEDLEREDARLTREYIRLRGRMKDKTTESALVNGQRAWIKFRDAWCAFNAATDEPPSPEVHRLMCLIDQTKLQADRLGQSAASR